MGRPVETVHRAGLTRQTLAHHVVGCVRRGKPWQPDILLIRLNSGLAVVKDYGERNCLFRCCVGILLTFREASLYRDLQGIRGVPAFYGRLDRYALVVEYIQGRNATQVSPGEVKPEFFFKLQELVGKVHERHIVLCDMRNLENILVGEGGAPFIVDFSAGFRRGVWFNPLKRFLFNIFVQSDLLGIAKLKKHLAPSLLSPEEERKLASGLFLERPANRLRDFLQKWGKKLVTKLEAREEGR